MPALLFLFSGVNLVIGTGAFVLSGILGLVAKICAAAGAGFTPLAAGIAVSLVPPQQRGKALALVFLGISLSYVVGVPLGSWIGFAHGWHVAVWAVTAASVVAALVVAVWVPSQVQSPGASFHGLGALLARRDVLSALLLTLLYFAAIFSVFSYIGPVLNARAAMDSTRLSLTLMLFGLSGVAGTLLGGAAIDRFGAMVTLRVQLLVLLAMMLVLPLTAGSYGAMLLVMLVWGTAGFGMMAPQQLRLTQMAPAQAPVLLSLNTTMLYLGTAAGAVVGGIGSTALGFAGLPWVGAPFALLGLVLLWASGTRRSATRRSAPVTD